MSGFISRYGLRSKLPFLFLRGMFDIFVCGVFPVSQPHNKPGPTQSPAPGRTEESPTEKKNMTSQTHRTPGPSEHPADPLATVLSIDIPGCAISRAIRAAATLTCILCKRCTEPAKAIVSHNVSAAKITGGSQPRSSGGDAHPAAALTMLSPSSRIRRSIAGSRLTACCLRCTAIHSEIEPNGFAVP